jgi:hypothetical protein
MRKPVRGILAFLFTTLLVTAAENKVVAGEPLSDAQRIAYHFGQTPTIPVQKKWKTIVILPSSEKVLDAVCGYKDDWDIYAPKDANFVMVTPLKTGEKTDLTLVSKSGNIYTFALQDVSNQSGAQAFTQVLVEVMDDKMKAALHETPKYYGADEVSAFRAQAEKAEAARQELSAQLEQKTEAAKDTARVQAQKGLRHDYKLDWKAADHEPWNLAGLYHNDKFTFIEAHPQEQFAVYEVKDGKPTAINLYPDGDGLYRLDRVVQSGYLKLGKKELKFSQ